MQKRLVYDLPTRFFHALFGLFFVVAFVIANSFGDESLWFAVHSLFGLMLGALLFMRVVWGVLGTRYARFNSFVLNPSQLVGYFTGILSGSKRIWAGHNPASSWSALLMWIFTVGLILSGTQMASGSKVKALKEVHEFFANGFFVVTVFHIGGVLLHSFRHRDAIALSMISGKKAGVAETEAISQSKPGLAVLFLVLVAAFGGYLWANFDLSKGTVQLFGTQLQLGEMEGGESEFHGDDGRESTDSTGNNKSNEYEDDDEDDD